MYVFFRKTNQNWWILIKKKIREIADFLQCNAINLNIYVFEQKSVKSTFYFSINHTVWKIEKILSPKEYFVKSPL